MSDVFKINVSMDVDKKCSYNVELKKWNGKDWNSLTLKTYGDRDEAVTIAENLRNFINNNKICSAFSPSIQIE